MTEHMQMRPSWFCRITLHRWSVWSAPVEAPHEQHVAVGPTLWSQTGVTSRQTRECMNCGLVQHHDAKVFR